MSQRSVEFIVGRLVTDEAWRHRFRRDARATLDELEADLRDPLTSVERHVLESVEPDALDRMAELLDPRLQKITLRSEPCTENR